MSSQLWSVSYTSIASHPLSTPELDALLLDAQQFNERVGVTGALCYDDGVFTQYFEGSPEAVKQVYARVRASRHHRDLVELANQIVDVRHFEGWHMAFCQAPDSLLQALANSGWESNIPLTRDSLEINRGLGQLVYHWNRWQAKVYLAGNELRNVAGLAA